MNSDDVYAAALVFGVVVFLVAGFWIPALI